MMSQAFALQGDDEVEVWSIAVERERFDDDELDFFIVLSRHQILDQQA